MSKADPGNILEKLRILSSGSTSGDECQKLISSISEQFYQQEAKNNELQSFINLSNEELKKVWQLTYQREHLIKVILDASSDAILTLDEHGQVIEFNHGAETLFGVSKAEIKGLSVFNILSGGSFHDNVAKYFENPNAESSTNELFGLNHEGTLINSKGIEFTVSILARRVTSGEKIFYPFYLKDLTAQKLAEREIEQSRAQLQIASKMSALGEMAGGVAHEINTPLAIIQLRTDQLLDRVKANDIEPEFFLKALNGIDGTVRRIGKIVYGLRSFARDGSNDPLMTYSLLEVINETLALCQEKFKNNGVDILVDINPLLQIECRPSEISQVLLNILNNAYDATQDLPNRWVKLACHTDQENLFLTVTDCGNGIPMEIQNKMMQPFFTTKEIGKGTGLGLSISRGIMEKHRGKMLIDNNCPNTQFLLQFPKVKAA